MTTGNRVSNYEKMKQSMEDVFLQYNQEEIIQKFSLEYDETYLYLQFVGRPYRINRSTGKISWSEDFFQTEETAGYHEAMTLYDVLSYSKRNCHPANEWVNISSLSTIQGGTLEKKNHFFQNVGEYFDGKSKAFAYACETLHGKNWRKGMWLISFLCFPFFLWF